MNQVLIPCEGSSQPVNRPFDFGVHGFCKMCGQIVSLDHGLACAHGRDDILARLDRGDFDA